METNIIMGRYYRDVLQRSKFHYLKGLLIRWKNNRKYAKAIRIARKNGASIGNDVVMPLSLAQRANQNLKIGNHVSIQSDKIDLRSPVTIGDYVIIGQNTEIITTSHNVDSAEWEHKYYGIVIEDYVWLPTKVLVLPSCRRIG